MTGRIDTNELRSLGRQLRGLPPAWGYNLPSAAADEIDRLRAVLAVIQHTLERTYLDAATFRALLTEARPTAMLLLAAEQERRFTVKDSLEAIGVIEAARAFAKDCSDSGWQMPASLLTLEVALDVYDAATEEDR